jgi:trigger factor
MGSTKQDNSTGKAPEIKSEKIAGSKMKINFTLDASEFDKFVKKVAEELSKNMSVDGFRKGKVPFDVVKKEAGEDKLLYEAGEEAVKHYYVDYIVNNNIEAVGQPEVKFQKIGFGEDLEVEIEVAILPEVSLKDNWKKAISEVNEKHKDGSAEATEEEIQHELNTLANQRAKISTVDREARQGDQVQVDFQVFKDNVALEGGTAQDHQLTLGQGRFIPGFEENLQGMKAGEEKDFDLQFPEEYHQKHLAGQTAKFKVKMKNVQQRDLPEINDEFASGIGKFQSLQELKDNIKKGLEEEKKKQAQQAKNRDIIEALVKNSEIELPEVLIDKEIEGMKSELESELSRMGLDKNSYFSQMGTTEEEMTKQWREKEAPNRVKAGLILRKLSKEEKLEPSKEDVQERATAILQQYQVMQGEKQENLDIQKIYESVKSELSNEKVLEYLATL